MRLKTLLPLTLLLVLTTPPSCAEQKTTSRQISASEYGIDLDRNYTGSEVAELIAIAASEAEQTIDRAFDEGYKQGLLVGVPEAEYWKTRSAQLEAALSKANREKWLFAFGGFGAGFLAGGGFGFSVRLSE